MQAADNIPDDTDTDDVTAPLLGRNSHNSSIYENNNGTTALLEPPDVYRSRWRSIRVMYLVMFLGSVTFTITMSSLWPFLQVLNPAATTSFLGWVVAAYSLGQLVASPFFGGWANIRNSSREPLTISLTLTVLSNIFYMYLESLPFHADYYMILARGLIGFSAGNVAVVRSYMSGATTVQERTATMANLSIFQAMGFILGPVIQAVLVPISYPGPANSVYFHFNMYTAPAFFAACVALIGIFLLIFVFKEHRTVDDDVKAILRSRASDFEDPDSVNNADVTDSLRQLEYKPDYVAVFSSIFLFFIVLFMFTVFETIGTPLTMHMYAWTKVKATLYQGIILGLAGILSIIVFLFVKMLAKKYSERFLLLGGFIFCLCGYFVFIPWGSKLPPSGFAPIINQTVSSSDAIFSLSDYLINGDHHETNKHISKRGASSDVHQPKLIHRFAIQDTGYYRDVFHSDSLKIKGKSDSDTRPSFVYIDGTAKQKARVTNSASGLSSIVLITNITAIPDAESILSSSSSIATTTVGYSSTTSMTTNSTYAPNGCPWQYDWCKHVPAIYLGQFLGGTMLISIGYPVCNMLSYALYSKVLGPKPQGLWMGWLTASGSLARTVGPIYVSQVYDSFGPQITFGSCCGLIFLTIVFYLVVFRRMVPFSFTDESLTQSGGNSTRERSMN